MYGKSFKLAQFSKKKKKKIIQLTLKTINLYQFYQYYQNLQTSCFGKKSSNSLKKNRYTINTYITIQLP